MIDKAQEIIDVSKSEWLESHCYQKTQANAGPPGTTIERFLATLPLYAPLENFGTRTIKD